MPATLSRNLELIIGARDRLTGPLRKIRASFQRFKNIAGTVGKIAAAGFAAATVAVVAFGKASVDAFAAFDTAMRNTWTLLDVGQGQFEALGDSILMMTQRVPQSADQLGAAVYDIISAGVSETGDALVVLEQSALAATAGVTSTKEAAGAAVAVMNSFGKSTEDIPGIFDLLFSTVKSGVVTFGELGPVVGRTSAAFEGAGASVEDMLGALAFLTKTGVNAAEASTQLRATMRALTKQAPELKKELGVAVFDAQGGFRGLDNVVGDFAKSLEGLTKEAQLKKIQKLVPSEEAQAAVIAMVGKYDELSATLSDVADSHGAMAEAAEKQMGSWDNQMKLLTNSFKGIKTGVGEIITAVLAPELGKFTKWLQGLQANMVKNKASMKAFVATITPTIKAVGTSIVDVLKGSFEIAWGFIKEFFMKLQESPRPLLILLGGLFNEIPKLLWTALQNAWEVVKAVSQILFTPFQGALMWVADNIRVWFRDNLKKPFIDFLNWAIEKSNKVREFFGKEPWELFPVDAETDKAMTFEEAWKDTFSVLKARFKDLGAASRDAVVNTVNEAVASLKELAGTLKGELITPDLQAKLDGLETKLAAIPKALEEGYEQAAAAATKAGEEAETALARVQGKRAEGKPKPGAAPAGEGAEDEAEGLGTVFGNAFSMALGVAGGNALTVLISTLFSAINEGDVSGFVNNIADSALDLIDGLVQGIPDFIIALVERVPEIIGALIAAIPQLIYELIVHIPEILAALGRGLVNLFEIGGRTIALAFITLVEKLIGGLLRFLGIELRDDIERLQNEINDMTTALGRAEAPEPAPAGAGTAGTAVDFARTATVSPGAAPVIIYNLEFAQPFVMSDQASMDQLARLIAEADYRQARRSSGSTGTA